MPSKKPFFWRGSLPQFHQKTHEEQVQEIVGRIKEKNCAIEKEARVGFSASEKESRNKIEAEQNNDWEKLAFKLEEQKNGVKEAEQQRSVTLFKPAQKSSEAAMKKAADETKKRLERFNSPKKSPQTPTEPGFELVEKTTESDNAPQPQSTGSWITGFIPKLPRLW